MAIKKVWSDDNNCDMWQADYRIRVGQKLKRIRKLYFTKEAAVKAIRKDKVDAERGDYKEQAKVTLGEWKDKVMKYVKAQRHGSTPKAYEHILSEFVAVFGAGRRVESLDRNDLHRYVEYLKAQGLSSASQKTYNARVRAALNLGTQLFDSLMNWSVPKYKFQTHSPPRERVLEKDEVRRLLLALPEQDHRDAFICALNTGGRLKEVLSLTWDRVLWNASGFRNGVVKLKVTKKPGVPVSHRVVPVTDELAAILRRRQKDSRSVFVFPSPKRKGQHRKLMMTPLQKACKATGILYGRDVAGGMVFHDLRRTSVTYLRSAGIDIETVIAITGHSAVVMLQTYSKTNPTRLQDAIDKLGNLTDAGQLKEQGENGESEIEAANGESNPLKATG